MKPERDAAAFDYVARKGWLRPGQVNEARQFGNGFAGVMCDVCGESHAIYPGTRCRRCEASLREEREAPPYGD